MSKRRRGGDRGEGEGQREGGRKGRERKGIIDVKKPDRKAPSSQI